MQLQPDQRIQLQYIKSLEKTKKGPNRNTSIQLILSKVNESTMNEEQGISTSRNIESILKNTSILSQF